MYDHYIVRTSSKQTEAVTSGLTSYPPRFVTFPHFTAIMYPFFENLITNALIHKNRLNERYMVVTKVF